MITPSFGLTATERVLPRLALDFTTASLDPRVTFTRTGNTATVTNSSGYVVPINADLPRFDFNPITLVCRGLLIEEARTNQFLYSADFSNAYWTQTACSVSAVDFVTAPDGVSNAFKILDTAVSTVHAIQRAISITSGTAYTMSAYAKQGTDSDFRITIDANGNAGSYSIFNLVTGTATSGAGASASIVNVGNGWYRCVVTATATATVSAITSLRVFTSNTGTSGVYMWGAQFETGAFPTSYIPTVASTVTRTADSASMTGTNFSDWFNATEGTFVAQSDTVDTTGFPTTFSSAVVNNGITLDTRVTSIRAVMFAGGAAVLVKTSTKLNVNTFAIAYKLNSHNAGFNAAAVTAATAGAVPTGLTSLAIGSTGSSNYVNGHIYRIMYYPQRLTDNELRAFTKG
jgi:hypothetical protein